MTMRMNLRFNLDLDGLGGQWSGWDGLDEFVGYTLQDLIVRVYGRFPGGTDSANERNPPECLYGILLDVADPYFKRHLGEASDADGNIEAVDADGNLIRRAFVEPGANIGSGRSVDWVSIRRHYKEHYSTRVPRANFDGGAWQNLYLLLLPTGEDESEMSPTDLREKQEEVLKEYIDAMRAEWHKFIKLADQGQWPGYPGYGQRRNETATFAGRTQFIRDFFNNRVNGQDVGPSHFRYLSLFRWVADRVGLWGRDERYSQAQAKGTLYGMTMPLFNGLEYRFETDWPLPYIVYDVDADQPDAFDSSAAYPSLRFDDDLWSGYSDSPRSLSDIIGHSESERGPSAFYPFHNFGDDPLPDSKTLAIQNNKRQYTILPTGYAPLAVGFHMASQIDKLDEWTGDAYRSYANATSLLGIAADILEGKSPRELLSEMDPAAAQRAPEARGPFARVDPDDRQWIQEASRQTHDEILAARGEQQWTGIPGDPSNQVRDYQRNPDEYEIREVDTEGGFLRQARKGIYIRKADAVGGGRYADMEYFVSDEDMQEWDYYCSGVARTASELRELKAILSGIQKLDPNNLNGVNSERFRAQARYARTLDGIRVSPSWKRAEADLWQYNRDTLKHALVFHIDSLLARMPQYAERTTNRILERIRPLVQADDYSAPQPAWATSDEELAQAVGDVRNLEALALLVVAGIEYVDTDNDPLFEDVSWDDGINAEDVQERARSTASSADDIKKLRKAANFLGKVMRRTRGGSDIPKNLLNTRSRKAIIQSFLRSLRRIRGRTTAQGKRSDGVKALTDALRGQNIPEREIESWRRTGVGGIRGGIGLAGIFTWAATSSSFIESMKAEGRSDIDVWGWMGFMLDTGNFVSDGSSTLSVACEGSARLLTRTPYRPLQRMGGGAVRLSSNATAAVGRMSSALGWAGVAFGTLMAMQDLASGDTNSARTNAVATGSALLSMLGTSAVKMAGFACTGPVGMVIAGVSIGIGIAQIVYQSLQNDIEKLVYNEFFRQGPRAGGMGSLNQIAQDLKLYDVAVPSSIEIESDYNRQYDDASRRAYVRELIERIKASLETRDRAVGVRIGTRLLYRGFDQAYAPPPYFRNYVAQRRSEAGQHRMAG